MSLSRSLRPPPLLLAPRDCHLKVLVPPFWLLATHVGTLGVVLKTMRAAGCLRKGVAAMPRRHLEKGKLAMTFGASLAGVPPTVPLFTLASSMCLRLRTMLMIFFPIRTVRFTACGIIGSRSHGVSLSELSLAPMALLHLVSHRVEAAPYQSAPPPFLARNVTNVHLQSV